MLFPGRRFPATNSRSNLTWLVSVQLQLQLQRLSLQLLLPQALQPQEGPRHCMAAAPVTKVLSVVLQEEQCSTICFEFTPE
jgi:hypothetical protein